MCLFKCIWCLVFIGFGFECWLLVLLWLFVVLFVVCFGILFIDCLIVLLALLVVVVVFIWVVYILLVGLLACGLMSVYGWFYDCGCGFRFMRWFGDLFGCLFGFCVCLLIWLVGAGYVCGLPLIGWYVVLLFVCLTVVFGCLLFSWICWLFAFVVDLVFVWVVFCVFLLRVDT